MQPAGSSDNMSGDSTTGHYIEQLRFSLNGKQIAEAFLGPYVAPQPITGIHLPPPQPGDLLVVDWVDNHGLSGHAESPITS
jgi:hypothetical protein